MRPSLPRLLILLSGFLSSQSSETACESTRQLPPPSGPRSVGTRTLHWIDPSREEASTAGPTDVRELVVQLWYPAADTGGGPFAPYVPELEALRPHLGQETVERLRAVRTNARLDAPVPDSSHPVLVFSHGLVRGRNDYTITAEELASHGYPVAGIDPARGALSPRLRAAAR